MSDSTGAYLWRLTDFSLAPLFLSIDGYDDNYGKGKGKGKSSKAESKGKTSKSDDHYVPHDDYFKPTHPPSNHDDDIYRDDNCKYTLKKE